MYLFQQVSGGPGLQFGSLQRNIYSSYRIGLVPCNSSKLVSAFVFNPRDLYYQGY